MLNQVISEIINLKWFVIIFAVSAVLFCSLLYFKTRSFDWSYKKIRAFAILYNLNKNGLVVLSLLLCRLIYVVCMAVFGGSSGFWDLLVLIAFTVLIVVFSGCIKDLLQIVSCGATFVVCVMENMFLGFYHEVEDNKVIVVVAAAFGLFAVLYMCYLTLISYDNLLIKTAAKEKYLFDKEFYENTRTDSVQN